MTAIRDLLKRGACYVGRRMSIKRVLADGSGYESSWYDITSYVKKWGTINGSFGDTVFLGNYQINGMTIELDNNRRRFNVETDSNSLFYGYLSRYGTRFKVEAFLYDDDNSEVAGRTFYGILYEDPTVSADGYISLSIASILKVFQNYPAPASLTAGDTGSLITQLCQQTSGGVRIFDRYFEGASDAVRYKINPESVSLTTIAAPTADSNQTIWDKMNQYAIYDNFFLYVDNTGNLVFTSRAATATVQMTLNGVGAYKADDGINIMDGMSELSGIKNLWTRVVIEYGTSGSTVTASSSWVYGDGSAQSKYGERIFNFQAKELSMSTAQTIANNLKASYSSLKREWKIRTKFIPHLEVKDLVEINYVGEPTTTFILGKSALGGTDMLGTATGSLFVREQQAKIIGYDLNLDDLTCEFHCREV